MPKQLDIVALLRQELRETKAKVGRLEQAVWTLQKLGRTGRRRVGKISAAGRKRIAAAQRKRWAKLRLAK